MQVLIVSPDTELVRVFSEVLVPLGHGFSHVKRGDEALRAALYRDWDLVVCDVNLPDMPGLELLSAIKAQDPRMPMVAVVEGDVPGLRQTCEDAGVTSLLNKPLDIEAVRWEIGLVDRGRASLRIALIDPDPIHRIRLSKAFLALGCTVTAYGQSKEAQPGLAAARPSFVIIDASLSDAQQVTTAAKDLNIPVIAFAEHNDAGLEDQIIRAGAALFFRKPVDCDALLIQARFLAS